MTGAPLPAARGLSGSKIIAGRRVPEQPSPRTAIKVAVDRGPYACDVVCLPASAQIVQAVVSGTLVPFEAIRGNRRFGAESSPRRDSAGRPRSALNG
jgi:hypothetical protein